MHTPATVVLVRRAWNLVARAIALWREVEFVWIGWANWCYIGFDRPNYDSVLRWWISVGPWYVRRYKEGHK